VIAIAIVVCSIIFLRIFSKKILQAKLPPETPVVRPLGLKICIILMILIPLPVLFSGGAIFLIGVFVIFLFGMLGLFILGFGAILLVVGIIILILGIGLWRMNHAAWKGTMIVLGVYAGTLFTFFMYIITYILGLSMVGLLAYLVMIRDQFIKIETTTETTKEKIQAITPGKCPVCQTQNEPEAQYCAFCGYNFRQGKKSILEE